MDDLLTPAEADALAAPFKPRARAGVDPWTPRTREAYLALELSRPVTDTVPADRVRADDVIPWHRPPALSPDERRSFAKQWHKRRAAHVLRVQRALGFTWDLTVVRELRARARAEAWALRGT